MISGKPIVRRARPAEADMINAMIMRSKSHWGYLPPVLEAYRPALSLDPEAIEHNVVYCAEVDGHLAGVSHIKMIDEGTAELCHLFVEPAFIGQGIGRLLWRHAVKLARSMGASVLVFDADPHARPFYARMGAVVIGDHASTVIPGLRIPRMRYDL